MLGLTNPLKVIIQFLMVDANSICCYVQYNTNLIVYGYI